MKNKVKSFETKLKAVKLRTENNWKFKKIREELNLSSDMLVQMWINKYKKFGEEGLKSKNIRKKDFFLKEDYEKQKIKILEKELTKANERALKAETENELLKKYITSWKITKLMTNNGYVSRCVKNKSYKIVDQYKSKVYSVKWLVSILPITEQGYYDWIKNKRPNYKNKYHLDLENKIKTIHSDLPIIGNKSLVINLNINNKLVKQTLCLSFDLFSDQTIAFALSKTENANLCSNVLKQISKKINNLKYNSIIHSDQGRGISSKIYHKIAKKYNLILSMSHIGFKGNQKCESLIGKIKKDFFQLYDNKFESYFHFKKIFQEFINMRNDKHIVLRLRNTSNNFIAQSL